MGENKQNDRLCIVVDERIRKDVLDVKVVKGL